MGAVSDEYRRRFLFGILHCSPHHLSVAFDLVSSNRHFCACFDHIVFISGAKGCRLTPLCRHRLFPLRFKLNNEISPCQNRTARNRRDWLKRFKLVNVEGVTKDKDGKAVFASSDSEFPRSLDDYKGTPTADQYHVTKNGELKAGKNGVKSCKL